MHKASLLFIFEPNPGLESSMSTLRSAQAEVPRTSCAVSRLLRPSFPFSWCIRYKQKRRLHFLAAAFLLIVCLLFDFICIFDAVDPTQ